MLCLCLPVPSQDQFEQHVRVDVKLNVYLYYGPERCRDPDFLAGQDVVLSTYNVLSSDFSVSGSLEMVLNSCMHTSQASAALVLHLILHLATVLHQGTLLRPWF